MTGRIPLRDRAGGRAAVCFLGLCLAAGPAAGKKLELKKKAGDLTVEITLERDPPTVSRNAIEVRIGNAAGDPIGDAKVLLNYYMPPMARMPPMNFRVEAKWKKDAYRADLNLIMAGPWIILVRVTLDDKTVTARFNIDAR